MVKRSNVKRQQAMINRIKQRIVKSGKGIANFVRIKSGTKSRIRFISEFGDAILMKRHDKWGELSPVPCLKYHFKKECEYCKIAEIRTRDTFAWTIYEYSSKKRKIFIWPATARSPVNQLVAAYDTYGTIIDRDYILSRRGERLDTVYNLMPLDKKKLEKKIKTFSETEILEKCIELSGEVTLEEIEDLPDPEIGEDFENLEKEYEFEENENGDEKDFEEEDLKEDEPEKEEEEEEEGEEEELEEEEDYGDIFDEEEEEEEKEEKKKEKPLKRVKKTKKE